MAVEQLRRGSTRESGIELALSFHSDRVEDKRRLARSGHAWNTVIRSFGPLSDRFRLGVVLSCSTTRMLSQDVGVRHAVGGGVGRRRRVNLVELRLRLNDVARAAGVT